MNRVLRIDSSITGDNSVSRQLASELIERLSAKEGEEGITLVERDFAKQPIPHLDGERLGALFVAAEARTPEQAEAVAFADTLIEELVDADTVVITLPMYNFSVPSMLKAWIDHVARAGVTFKYTESGVVGLLENKKVYLVSALGGIHEAGVTDFMRPYIKQVLGFLGITDVESISAEGLNMGDEARAEGLSKARSEIQQAVA